MVYLQQNGIIHLGTTNTFYKPGIGDVQWHWGGALLVHSLLCTSTPLYTFTANYMYVNETIVSHLMLIKSWPYSQLKQWGTFNYKWFRHWLEYNCFMLVENLHFWSTKSLLTWLNLWQYVAFKYVIILYSGCKESKSHVCQYNNCCNNFTWHSCMVWLGAMHGYHFGIFYMCLVNCQGKDIVCWQRDIKKSRHSTNKINIHLISTCLSCLKWSYYKLNLNIFPLSPIKYMYMRKQ